MKKRFLYLLLPLVVLLSGLTAILPSASVDAAPSQNTQASDYCKGNSSVKSQNACVQGYLQGQQDGGSQNKDNSSSYCSSNFPNNQQSCQTGYEQAFNASDSSSSVTCESDGDPLDWILCPIFNGVANLSHWLFANIVQPWLVTTPISTSQSDPMYKAWSNFRIYGDIFLVIALLVVVFGQSIGGGLIDAYSAKKILPRLLAAAVLINISIYLVAALVDISNVVGGSIGSVITAPLHGAGAFVIHPNGIAAGKVIGLSLTGGTLAFAAGLVALFTHTGSGIIGWLLLFIVMPMILGILATFLTLVIRKGLIIALVLVSPIAFALYCLPNTEHIFRRWWKLLLEMLMIYPIVVVIFAISDVLSVTTVSGNGAGSALGSIVSFVLQFLPLVFVPYAFRLAGGTLASAHEFMTTNHKRLQEGIKGNANDPWSLRNRTKRKVTNSMLMKREALRNAGDERQNAGGRYGAIPRMSNMLFGNDDVLRARMNKESAEMREGLTGAGDDWRYRALFARQMAYSRKTGKKDANGNDITETAVGWFGIGARTQKDAEGNDMIDPKTGLAVRLGQTGTQYSDEQVRIARSQGSIDPSHYQAALTYEFTKAGGLDAGEDDMNVLKSVNLDNMDRMRVSPQATPTWIGTVFSNQSIYRNEKHTRPKVIENPDGSTQRIYERDSFTHMREVAGTSSTYAISNLRFESVDAMTDDAQNALDYITLHTTEKPASMSDADWTLEKARAAKSQADLAAKSKQTRTVIKEIRDMDQAKAIVADAQSTARTLNMRMSSGAFAMEGEGEGAIPLSGAQTGAPGKVNDAIQRFIGVALGPSGSSPSRPSSPPSGGTSPGEVILPPGVR